MPIKATIVTVTACCIVTTMLCACGDPPPQGNTCATQETPPAAPPPRAALEPAPVHATPRDPPVDDDGGDAATLVSATLPAALSCGEQAEAVVVMRNDGDAAWSADYRLGAVDDGDPLGGPGRVRLDQDVAPGAEHAFTFTLTAPAVAGTFTTDWRMVHELVRWFGPVAQADVVVTCPPDPDPDAFHFEDSLRGGTQGLAVGGTFGDDGWRITGDSDRLIFALPRLDSGAVELTLKDVGDNLVKNDNDLLALYEGGYGMTEPIPYNPELRDNHYKALLRVYGSDESDRPGAQKLMWGMCPDGAPGTGTCACGAQFFEEPFTREASTWTGAPVRLRIEWGGGHTRYLKDGVLLIDVDWSATGLRFAPQALHMSLGTPRPSAVGTAGMPIGAVFSDLVVDGHIAGEVATCP